MKCAIDISGTPARSHRFHVLLRSRLLNFANSLPLINPVVLNAKAKVTLLEGHSIPKNVKGVWNGIEFEDNNVAGRLVVECLRARRSINVNPKREKS